MRIVAPHRWDVSPSRAKEIQQGLRSRVSTERAFSQVNTVAGVDVSIKGEVARAAIVVLSYPELTPVDYSLAELPAKFPYIPGLLAFREAPAVLAALEELKTEPDLFIFDAQGLAHPRRLGLATHLGVIIDRPSIGCAKSRLCGSHHEPGPDRGSYTHLYDDDEIIGAVVRTRTGVNPLYVSIGHQVDLPAAIEYVLGCCTKYRLPETTRYAHRVAGGERLQIEVSQPALFEL
ncbi:MAG: deoxyribonuclease V [Anaerolineae bacterium]|nr:deoxyribonuclease V [Anaerolineae bacterium]